MGKHICFRCQKEKNAPLCVKLRDAAYICRDCLWADHPGREIEASTLELLHDFDTCDYLEHLEGRGPELFPERITGEYSIIDIGLCSIDPRTRSLALPGRMMDKRVISIPRIADMEFKEKKISLGKLEICLKMQVWFQIEGEKYAECLDLVLVPQRVGNIEYEKMKAQARELIETVGRYRS